MKEETLKKYIGVTKGVITVLELDHETYDKEKQCKRSFFKVKCNRCGKISIMRADRFTNNGKDYPKSCIHCVASLQKEISDKRYPPETKLLREKLSRYTHNSKRKGKTVKSELTEEEAKNLLLSSCFYCGEPVAMGIDRIDSTKDYTIDNCVPCCGMCNIMKNKFTQKEFLDKVSKIYNLHYDESSTTISKESTSEVNADGSAELLTAA